MNVSWLVEEDAFPENLDVMYEALDHSNIHYKSVSGIHLQLSNDYLRLFDDNDCVVLYCSLQFAKKVRRESRWVPGVFYDIPLYNCVHYYARLGKYLLNSNYAILPYGELHRQKEFLYQTFAGDRTVFIRPNRGDKIFTGQLVFKENFDQAIENLNFKQISPEELVVVSEPVNIAREWRFIAAGDNIIAGSQYKEKDKVRIKTDFPKEAMQFAQEVLNYYKPEPVFVIDVCETKSGLYKLVEIGCFSCAGLYQCDRDAVVQAVSDEAIKCWKDIYEV